MEEYARKGITAQEQREVLKSEALVEIAVISLLALALQRYVTDETRKRAIDQAVDIADRNDVIASILKQLNRAIEHDGGKPVRAEYCLGFMQVAWETAIAFTPRVTSAKGQFLPIA